MVPVGRFSWFGAEFRVAVPWQEHSCHDARGAGAAPSRAWGEVHLVGCPNLIIVLLPTLAVQRAIDIRVIYMDSLRHALYDTYIPSLALSIG